jgi:hypothetical protein
MAGNAVYDNAITHFVIGEVTWNSSDTDIRVILNVNQAPTKTDAHWSDVGEDEVTEASAGYDRCTMQIGTLTTAHTVSAVTHFESTATAWTAATFTAYYASTCHGAVQTNGDPLISYHNIGTQAVVNGTLTLTWANASGGVFTMTSSDET